MHIEMYSEIPSGISIHPKDIFLDSRLIVGMQHPDRDILKKVAGKIRYRLEHRKLGWGDRTEVNRMMDSIERWDENYDITFGYGPVLDKDEAYIKDLSKKFDLDIVYTRNDYIKDTQKTIYMLSGEVTREKII